MNTYIYMYTYTYMYMYTYTHIYIYIFMCTHIIHVSSWKLLEEQAHPARSRGLRWTTGGSLDGWQLKPQSLLAPVVQVGSTVEGS